MNTTAQQEEALMRNLRDAGCSKTLIEQFIEHHKAGNAVKQECILSEHRRTILHSVHVEQYKLDCLDYLIFNIRKTDLKRH